MIGQNLRDRAFQRYGIELTPEILGNIVSLCMRTPGAPDKFKPGREHVWIRYGDMNVGVAWHRPTRTIFTFLPGMVRIARCLPKRKRRR